MADLKIVISALNKASGDLKTVKSDIEGIGDAGKGSDGKVKDFGESLLGIVGTAATVVGALYGVKAAITEVFDAAKEGAQLDYAADKFDRLSTSIGTTSRLLLEDMKEATRGVISDFELVELASTLMSLGLATNHDDVVRLSSVAGALGMNMNQLTLSLANMSTARLDQLGLSAAAVTTKFEELKKAGMPEEQAYFEAFVQAGETAIQTMGHVADSAMGIYLQSDAAMQTWLDNRKRSFAEDGNVVSSWMEDFNRAFEHMNTDDANKAIIKYANSIGLVSDAEMKWANMPIIGTAAERASFVERLLPEIQAYEEAIMASAQTTDDWANANYEGAGASLQMAEAQARSAVEVALLTAEMERQAKIQAELADVTSLTKNLSGMISLAKSYDKTLEDIVEQETIMANNPIGSEKYDEAKAKVDALKQSMADLANQVVLDMFQATISIGGVTEEEANAYFTLAADMNLISDEAAAYAMAVYGEAIGHINDLAIDDKTGNVILEVDSSEPDNYQPPTKRMLVEAYLDTSRISGGGYNTVTPEAVGGNVYAGNPYGWQEYGYRGELFVPSQDGYILSRAEAERALARALVEGKTGGSEIDYERLANVLSQVVNNTGSQKGGNTYNLNVQGGGSPSKDVAATFDLLRAYGGNF